MKPETLPLPRGPGAILENRRVVESAYEILKAGGLVAFPTDTVYGLSADFSRAEAVERLYNVKGRDRSKPVARLAADAGCASQAAETWPDLAAAFARAFWPGALTLVVEGIGVRVPAHEFARSLARRMGGTVAATSANRSGGPEARTAAEVVAALGAEVDLVLDGGRTEGAPSSVVRVYVDQTGAERFEVLRAGAIAEADISRVASE